MPNVTVDNSNDETTMANATLQQLQKEVAFAMMETLNDSKFTDLLAKYSLLENGVVKIKCEINKNKIQSNQAQNMDLELKDALDQIPESQVLLLDCCMCLKLCCVSVGTCACCK
ncbi:hypothetical protein NIES2101_30355 [Calothrix sp. HK-06]|nr:hypothetical protein NIES2101_30355 [Calothrix sp. HK-06]